VCTGFIWRYRVQWQAFVNIAVNPSFYMKFGDYLSNCWLSKKNFSMLWLKLWLEFLFVWFWYKFIEIWLWHCYAHEHAVTVEWTIKTSLWRVKCIVVGIHRGIGIFSFFYDVMRISATMMSLWTIFTLMEVCFLHVVPDSRKGFV